MYFRSRVGRATPFSPEPSRRDSRFAVRGRPSLLSLPRTPPLPSPPPVDSVLLPFREPRCNNGCPLIIGRPRHFKEIPRAHHGPPFRSRSLKSPSPPAPPRVPRSLSSCRERASRESPGNKNNQRGGRCRWKISFESYEGAHRENTGNSRRSLAR